MWVVVWVTEEPDSETLAAVGPFVTEVDAKSYAWGAERFDSETGRELYWEIVELEPVPK